MRTRTLLASLATLAFTAPALAQDNFSYSYVELGWVNTELDDFDADGDGFGLRASYELTEEFHVFGGYLDQDFDFGITREGIQIGAGYAHPLKDGLDLIGRVSYLQDEVSANVPGLGNFSVDDDGFGAGVGLRSRVTEQLELNGSLDYVSFDDAGSDTTFGVGGLYSFNKLFSLGADLGYNDDGTSWTIGGRLTF